MMACSLSFVPMAEHDLDWVVEQETVLHRFPWSRRNFTDSLAAGHTCWLMRDADVPVGYAVMLVVLDEAHLLNISVVRAAQGHGLGSRLLEYLFSIARCSGIRQFFLEVRPSNLSALALYRRAGFVEIARRKGYYPSPEGREDAIVMRFEP
ncbi:MAG: ribosomal protein S18-alanine N-acetyltransferase [Proteobacteria bacterium]|jgi:ribosomal-protein-alanine N-acetyltransferase|nr:ribosomal protein S18-alanine N-acetyltransferase [Pseudomonadota bacterium]